MLHELPTVGRTLFSEGFLTALQMIHTQRIKDKVMIPLLVLVTDGKASSKGGNVVHDALRSAKLTASSDTSAVVIDTEAGMFPLGLAKEISINMNAAYMKAE